MTYTIKQAGLGNKERQLIDAVIGSGKTIIHGSQLQQEFGYSNAAANLMLSRLYQKGWLQRLKAGVYRIVPLGSDSANPIPEDAWTIAMEMFAPAYIGGWTAAEHWDLTEQIFNTTVVFSAHKQKSTDQTVIGLSFKIKFLQQKNLFGTTKIWSENMPIQLSDLHRTLIDVLDDPAIGGGGRSMIDIFMAYKDKKEADPEMLWQYARQLDNGGIFKRLGFLSERILKAPVDYLEKIQTECNTGIVLLDPQGPRTGPIIKRWGIRINIPLADVA
jgi:predicted transcriptional regulator of viral defense system